MIKKIYAFGTSFTEGGGFEFDILQPQNLKCYQNVGEELTRFNFSYPGQLQKLLPNIKVTNLAKSGFGNERMYRLATDLILSDNFNKEETLLLFEWSFFGRKEIYSRKLKDYIIINYTTPKNSKIPIMHGYARTYLQKKEISEKELSLLPDWNYFEKLVEITFNKDVIGKKMFFSTLKFLSLLKNKKVNFLITQKPFDFHPNLYNKEIYEIESHFVKNLFEGKCLDYCMEDLGTIGKETAGVYQNGHFGFISNKMIASKIHDELIERNYIKGETMNMDWSDYYDLLAKIRNNII